MSDAAPVSLERALALYTTVRDVVEERVDGPEPPRWALVRGWDRFLLEMGNDALDRAEALGAAAFGEGMAAVPGDLRELAREVLRCTALERLDAGDAPPFCGSLRKVSRSKRAQLDGVLRLCAPLARRAARVVDVGSGHGHLARWMAEAFDLPVLGLERVPERVTAARRLSSTGANVAFDVADLGPARLALEPSDLATGLHACGELGDTMVRAAARAHCNAVLVGCCFQKIHAPAREPLSSAARGAGFVLGREHLGLANLTVRPVGVAGTLAETLRARRQRLALRSLLRERGFPVEHGQEMRGLNRRKAYGELERMAADALAARDASAPRPGELDRALAAAEQNFERIRRLSLPRNMLSRLLEVTMALDRARFLEEHGLEARLVRPFDEEVSPRNIALVATAG